MENMKAVDTAKERVEKELDELKEKIVKLTSFLFSKKMIEAELSHRMQDLLAEQLRHMQDYARILQARLSFWGKTDEEIYKGERVCGCY